MLPDQTTALSIAISPVAASQLVSRTVSDNAPVRTSHDLAMRNYHPSLSPCSYSADS